MANINGTQINQSATIVEEAGAAIADVRNKVLVYDANGKAVLATDGSKPYIGIAIIEAGYNDIDGAESGKVAAGDDIDIQIKDIGRVLAGAAIAKGAELAADANGKVVTASSGDYVLGVALSAASAADEYVRVQIRQYKA